MPRISKSVLFAWFVIGCVALSAVVPVRCRAQGFPPLSPDDLKMTNEPKAPGAAAIILYREVDRDDSGQGTIHEDNYYRIKILTEEGRKYADREIPFVKGLDEVLRIQARTIKPDGSIVEFDGKVLEKYLVKARGVKVLAKSFNLPAVEPGCVIEYSYTLDLHHAYASHWIVSEELFTRNARFSLKPFRGGYTPITLRQFWQNLPAGVEPKTLPDRSILMEISNIPAFQTEDFMPPANELKARVDFAYETGEPENDPEVFWKRVGKVRNDQLEKFVGKHKAIDDAVAQIVSANDPAEVKLRKIYDRVQQVHYTSFELQKTQQEAKREKEKVDESVDDVWKRGYGNFMQLDWLFLALVRAAGFEAYGCWVSSRAEYFFSPKTMQSGHLNEPVVLVQLNGQYLFFNPGMAFAPFTILNWSETATAGLRLDKDGGGWIKTTLPKSSASMIQRTAKLKLSENGDLEGKLSVTYTGLEAMYRRTSEMHSDEVSRRKTLEEAVTKQIPVAAEAKLTNQPDWSNSEAPLVAEFDVSIPAWASSAGKRTLLPAGLFTAIEKHVFEHANRIHPIYIDYPYEKDDDVTIELPASWEVGSLPPPQVKDGHIVTYSLKVDKTGATLHMTRKISWDFLLLEAKYYPALRDFFQLVRTGDDQQIVLQPAATSASN
jgi:hypothetical protein